MRTRPDPLRHWEYFVAVAEEGSVTGAAERLGLTQSPVSQGLKREASLGLELIRRSASGTELRLGLAPSVPPAVAFELTSALTAAGRVTVRTADVAQLVSWVQEGCLDCAVIEDPAPARRHIRPPDGVGGAAGRVLLDNTAPSPTASSASQIAASKVAVR